MYKKFVLILTLMILFCSTASLAARNKTEQEPGFSSLLDTVTEYYPDASLTGAIEKYKKSNYLGCIQELFSYIMKEPDDAVAYYYIAMSYANIGDSKAAVETYQKVIDLAKDPKLVEYATKGKDCLTNGPLCLNSGTNQENTEKDKTGDEKSATDNVAKEKEQLEKFINEPYGNGLSSEMEKQMKEEKLKRIQESINKKNSLENEDIQRIKNFDNTNSSQADVTEKIAKAEPSDKEILNAIKTLRDAGINVSVQASSDNSYVDNTALNIQPQKTTADDIQSTMVYQQNSTNSIVNGYTDPQMAKMSMMLGNNNNNNGMMNMLPFLIQQNQSGQNIDPQLMQAVMLQQMMPSMDFGLNNNN